MHGPTCELPQHTHTGEQLATYNRLLHLFDYDGWHDPPRTPQSPIRFIGPTEGGICQGCGLNYLLPECTCIQQVLDKMWAAEEAGLIRYDYDRKDWISV